MCMCLAVTPHKVTQIESTNVTNECMATYVCICVHVRVYTSTCMCLEVAARRQWAQITTLNVRTHVCMHTYTKTLPELTHERITTLLTTQTHTFLILSHLYPTLHEYPQYSGYSAFLAAISTVV